MSFKPLQIFLFSLIPLALVFTGVVVGSIHGSDSMKEIFPTPAPSVQRTAPTPSAPGAVVLQLRASNLAYDKRTLQAGPGSPVTLQFDNADPGVLHNFALYNNNTASQTIFRGDLVTGPAVVNFSFTSPPAGTYFFRCDSHPDTMTGTFTSR